ncbi:RmlC-like cupin domain superfamily [Sesbania bispinosa]|nr:RmlC-like cupin domain superfamily [Sesbania bispinosa]
MEPPKAFLLSPFSLLLIFLLSISLCGGVKASSEEVKPHEGPVVEKGERTTLHVTEYGEISAAEVKVEHGAPPYHLQFFTLDPNSLFLPVLLHADMVFYVHTGSGRLTYADEDGSDSIHLREGDLCSLREGSAFYIQSSLEPERKKLRIYAMFTNTDDSTFDPLIGAYSRIDNLVKGFDKKIMQAAFKVPEDLVEAITNKTDTPAIVHADAVSEKQNTVWELEASFLKNFLGIQSNSKRVMKYNIFDHDPDFKNRNGWTLTVTQKQLKSLKHHHIGFLMVNLIEGSILGPHWNPRATEIAVVLEGEGMIRVVCGSSNDDKTECKNMRFKVKQGDVFVVPRFHPMAQMSFKNEPLVFLGFSTAAEKNHPQFVAGPGSVLQNLDKRILAASMDVSKPTIDQLLASRDGSIIFRCTSCAEEEEKIMKEEEEKEREEEEAKEREKEKKREEEEARRREKERKREEEEARRQQEERERRREEEEARRERKREEEAESEEEAARRQKERREEEAESEEEAAKRQQEKRERRRQEEEARRERERRREEEEEREEARKERERRREEEAEREKERARRQQERRRREKEEEEAEAEREEEAARRQQEKRERERTREEEEARREEEREHERSRRQRERRREEEEGEPEEEAARRQQEEREERREEEERERGGGGRRRHRRGERGRSRGGEEAAEWEEEEARRQQEERERRRERDGDDEGRRVLKVWDV